MIIHHKEDFSNYQVRLLKKLKYSETFSFVPLKIINKETQKTESCIFQTPFMFAPYGIKTTMNNKTILDISFLNKENDKCCSQFLENLEDIFQTIKVQYSNQYEVNHFCKDTLYNECMRLKVGKPNYFNQEKEKLETINSYSYGIFLIHLHGLWINDNKIWFQWYLLQAKIIEPLSFQEYCFIDADPEPLPKPKTNSKRNPTKYDKMLKMGIPKEAVEQQMKLDSYNPNNIPPPPPPPSFRKITNGQPIPKISASDLQNVVLRSNSSKGGSQNQPNQPNQPNQQNQPNQPNQPNQFEPPSLEELQITLSKLKSIN